MRVIWSMAQRLHFLTGLVHPWSARWLLRALLATALAGLLVFVWPVVVTALAAGAVASLLMKRGLLGTLVATGLVTVATLALVVVGPGHLVALGPPAGWLLGLADRRGAAVRRSPAPPTPAP